LCEVVSDSTAVRKHVNPSLERLLRLAESLVVARTLNFALDHQAHPKRDSEYSEQKDDAPSALRVVHATLSCKSRFLNTLR
jgi:hypothetical protein